MAGLVSSIGMVTLGGSIIDQAELLWPIMTGHLTPSLLKRISASVRFTLPFPFSAQFRRGHSPPSFLSLTREPPFPLRPKFGIVPITQKPILMTPVGWPALFAALSVIPNYLQTQEIRAVAAPLP